MEKNEAKRVLVTSNGDEISVNIALHLARRGCRLVLMGDEGCLRKVKEKITEPTEGAAAATVAVVGLDMEDGREGGFDEAVDKAWNAFGHLDALVNCYAYQGKIQDHLELRGEELEKIIRINFTAAMFLLNAVAKRMRDRKSGGSIVFMTTILGAERGLHRGAAAYGSCLAAVQQLTRLSALEIGKHKIRVNAIARGLHLEDEYLMWEGKETAEKLVKDAVPLKRWLEIKHDLASTVVYLISDGSRYMTGTTVFVDGAQSLTRPRMRSFM
ncbi:squamosa promoter-binding-like protein 13A-like [Hibiscus syriacus]|uniref:Squamosa promoter-binding-like protein 13A-like n=1 Tax=Hibiscus syriacus TaxID=106335 RepID=A0A6A3BPC0_HIBSY|nr:2-dehydro-3-deoxy-D-gluconate 5-dehydrogenase-like [Hibiscus syriacus]KAE8718185.1 squamosa promoter-binding-like protein 13A-like [Hibiscus syriacus]